MSLDEEALQTAANGGPIDLERWKGIATPLIERLEYIVYNVFPMPQMRPESISQRAFPNPSSQESAIPPESSNKENAAPEPLASPQAAQTGSPRSSEQVPDSQPQPSGASMDGRLPPPLAFLLSAIRSSITSFFQEKPPHTIQRLAELVLYPTKHYKTLPAYLRAVDRVVSVTSPADIFPFQTSIPANAESNGLVHPGNSGGVYMIPDHAHGLGSDESLGGALLTPISWLNNSSFESEDANGDVDVLVEGTGEPLTTQPEEVQETAAPVPTESEEAPATASPEPSDEVPHARGPILLGVEDMGLQDGKGIEMSLSTDSTAGVPAAVAATPGSGEQGKESTADKDGDIVLEDKPKEKTKTEDTTEPQGDNVAPEQTGDLSQAPDADKQA